MKNINTIILVISLVFNIVYFIKFKTTISELDDCNYLHTKSEELLAQMTDSYIVRYEYDNKVLEADKYFSDTLRSLTKDGPKLLLCFNQQSCESCVSLALNEINGIGANIGYNNLIIVTNFSNNREAKYLGERFDEKINVINYQSDNMIFLGEKYQFLSPNFFILNDNLKVSHFFIFSIDNPTLNDRYFKQIESYYKFL